MHGSVCGRFMEGLLKSGQQVMSDPGSRAWCRTSRGQTGEELENKTMMT